MEATLEAKRTAPVACILEPARAILRQARLDDQQRRAVMELTVAVLADLRQGLAG